MGLFDKANLDKAKALAEKNQDRIVGTVTKVTAVIDDKTGGKYRNHLQKVDDATSKYVGAGPTADATATDDGTDDASSG